uniref:Uncharacterized protein n=1 Tax=Arundo donax TaxID=35708 RepID=A0A0A8YM40_ARUDO
MTLLLLLPIPFCLFILFLCLLLGFISRLPQLACPNDSLAQ